MANFVYMTKAKWIEICNEIREKTKYTKTMTAEEARQKIAEITSGGITIDEIIKGKTPLHATGATVETDVDRVYPGALYQSKVKSFKGVNVKYVGERAFYGCEDLTTLDLPKLYTSYQYAFYGLLYLRGFVEFPEFAYIGDFTFSKSGIGIISLPKARYVNEGTFAGCNKLIAVELGASVTIIRKNVFDGCSNVKALVVNTKEPPSLNEKLGGAFESSSASFIYVPDASVEAYKKYGKWKNYATKIKPISQYTRPSI